MQFPTHIVAVGGFIKNSEGKVLMALNPKRGWDFPGGIVEVGETLTEALIREVKEETGIDIYIQGLVGIHSNISEGIHYDGISVVPTIVNIDFCGYAVSGELKTSPESLEVGWFNQDQLIDMAGTDIIRDRLKFMINYNGKPVYRAYTKNPYTIKEEIFV